MKTPFLVRRFRVCLSVAAGLLAFPLQSNAETANWQDYYHIERIDYPSAIDPQIGGLTAMQDGRIALVVHHGDLVIYNPKENTWSTFASGLHTPLGIVEEAPGKFVVMQKPELTRLVDVDGDNVADRYETLYDDFGMTGNYHEFAFGPAVDSQRNYYIGLNVASNFNGINEYIRGEYSPYCQPEDEMRKWHDFVNWRDGYRKQVTRMFSCVPYRGWVMKITPQGEATPFALGFRSPAGLDIDAKDRLWVTDNQGDWIGTSPLHQVNQGDFAGHPAALHWQPGWHKAHKEITPTDLKPIRKLAAGLFPQGELANSPTQPLPTISRELFGLPEGELLIGDMNTNHLIRFLPDDSSGAAQGTLIPFIAGDELGIGNFRLDFSADGTLWIGKIHLGWAGDEGLLKISKKEKSPLLVEKVEQIQAGFKVHLSAPLTPDLGEVSVTRHGYHYHAKYGSEKIGLTQVLLTAMDLDASGKVLTLRFDQLMEDQLYTIDLSTLQGTKQQPIMGSVLRYHLVKLVAESK